ncbi:MAG: HlyD family secretion protein [Microgenomates group bacterium Gr01-1014_16]|nr:MAG: HlyD family secretion protein [Microgenomates group bacterium Gr01-1014_16]
MRKRWLIIGAIFLAVIGFFWIRNRNKNAANKSVKTVAVERKDVVQTLTLSGKVAAEREAKLRFLSSGKLGYIKVKEGDVVKKGQSLMGLDQRDLAAAETAAYYSYIAADANAKEAEDLVKGHDKDETYVQKNDRVAAQTARDKAYEAWQTAIRAKQNGNLVAPIDGVVVNVSVNVSGETVGVTDGVDIVDPESLYFDTEVDEADLNKIVEGMEARVKLDAFAGRDFEGTILKIGYETRVSDTGATVIPVRVKLSNMNLRVGLNGDATVVTGEAKNVLTLPIEAVVDGKVENAEGEKINVETGLEGETDIEIRSGVKEGDKIVIR